MNKKLYVLALPVLAVLFLFGGFNYHGNQACASTQNHCNPVPSPVCDNGKHVGNPHCVTPTPTQGVTPTPTDEVTPTPTDEPDCEGGEVYSVKQDCPPEVTPTPTEEVTPTPTETPKNDTGGTPPTFAGSSTEAPQCGKVAPTKVGANFHIYRNGEDAVAKWFPTEGNHVNIYYRNLNDSSDVHALRDVDNDGYEDNLHLLGSKDWEFGLQQSNDCAGGPVVWVKDGSTKGWTLFR